MGILDQAVHEALRGSGGGQKQQRAPIEAPDSLRSTAYARILDLVSEGEIYGFADQTKPLTCIFLNETPVAQPDGKLNFKNIQVDSRTGTQTQDPIKGFDGVESELGVNVELLAVTPWTRAINNINLTSIRVRISTPAMSSTNMSNGDTNGTSVKYAIDLATDGGSYETVLNSAFTGKTSSKYERSHVMELPPATTGWTVRVRRLTPDSTSGTLVNKTFIESITEIIDAKLRMPMSAVIATIVDAEQFNNIPSRAFRLKGRIIRVPSNYDPDTRVYTGLWDGTFQSRYSNNPAWVFYDMATNKRYGLGHLVPESLVDKWVLYKIAQYCDELVPDGFGGMEPRFTCNLYLQSQGEALRVMQDLATVFRGVMYAAGGAITAVGDMPEDPVYAYTPANVIDGKFVYSGSAKKVRHTVALVSWNDLNDFGRAKVEYIDDEDGILRYGLQPTEVIAMGCTSRGQARRLGKYILTTERYETDTVSFSVGLDGTFSAPGKIILVQDPLRAGRRNGGRIRTSTINSITVDKIPTVVSIGDDITAMLPNGVAEKRQVSSVVGDVIGVTPNWSQPPIPQSVWVLESEELAAQRFRVLAVTEKSDSLGYDIMAVQHVEGKFAFVEQNIAIEEPPISSMPSKIVASPTNVQMTHRDVADENSTQKIITLTWDAVLGAGSYNIQYRFAEGSWVDAGNTSATSFDINGMAPGVFEVSITAINSMSNRSAPAYGGPYDIAPNIKPPGFLIAVNAAISDALTAAENAQATADGAVVTFWQTTAPVIGAGVGQAKVGDIWFDTDDGNKIYRVVGSSWVLAADDDLAQAILAAANAQATADGKVTLFVGAVAPTTGMQLNDMWFNTVSKQTYRWNGADWNTPIADVTLDQLAGNGTNIMPAEYSLFEQGFAPVTVRNSTVVTALPELDVASKVLGAPMLKWTTTGNDGYLYFDDSTLQYNIPVTPGKRWIVSFYVKSDVANAQMNVYMKRNNDAGHTLGSAITTPAVANTIQRISSVVNMTAFTATDAVVLRIDLDVAGTVWVGGIMIEEQIGNLNVPAAYTRGTYSALYADAIAIASAAQDTADGKIETYFQATMPVGASLGDLWFDTDDGNKIYRHNGTTFVEIQDDAIALAIANAAGAQATADGKITTYYSGTAPGGTKSVGDLWYDTVGKDLSRWNGAAWVQVSDVTADKIGGNGSNVLWEEYSLLKAVMPTLSDPIKSIPLCNSANLTTLEVVKNAAAVGGYEYHAVTGATAPGGDYFRLAESATDNNIRVGGNRKYLISYYARSTTAGHQIRPWVRGAATIDGTTQALTTVRTRYSSVFDMSAVADGDAQFGFFCNTSGVAGRHVYIDGVMIEPMEGNKETPSTFIPGQSARQAWRAILNTQNVGNGRNLVGNPSCTDNFVGGDGVVHTATGEIYCDNWYNGLQQGSLYTQWDKVTGRSTNGASIFIAYGNGNSIAAGGTFRTIAVCRRRWAVIPGEKYTISCWARGDFNISVPAGVTCTAWLRAAFYDGSGTFLSYAQLSIPRAGGWVKQTIPNFTVPANAAAMDVRIDFNAVNSNGTTTTIAANNWAWILRTTDFEVFKVTNLDDDVEDGVVHGRIANEDTFAVSLVRRLGLRVGNSGHRLGNQRNNVRSSTSAYGMARTTTALSATSAGAVSVNAHTVRYGGYSVAYSAVANAVTGLTVGTTYVIYCSDADLSGGARTYFATTSPAAAMNISDDIYVVGQITIPSSGTSSGGGGSDGSNPGDWCVDANMVLPDGRRAGDIQAWELIPCWNDDAENPAIKHVQVESNALNDVECTRIVTVSGAQVVASNCTPMTLRDGSMVRIPEMYKEDALVRFADGRLEWERVVLVEPVGIRTVAKIKVHQHCYFAGIYAGATIATHNPTYKP